MIHLDLSILGPALLAGLLVLATHVPLGREVLGRGIIFIDLAVAQIAGMGVIVADSFGLPIGGAVTQMIAAAAALGGAALLRLVEWRWPRVQEAIIGVVFVLAATGSLLFLAQNPHGGEHLAELLAGQILWSGEEALRNAALATLLLLGLWFVAPGRRGPWRFYLVFALAVTVSVQLVGVYLVFASLILPALATHGMREGMGMAVGYLIGGAGYLLGLVLSLLTDLPAGPLIVWTLALLTLVTVLITGCVWGKAIYLSRRERA